MLSHWLDYRLKKGREKTGYSLLTFFFGILVRRGDFKNSQGPLGQYTEGGQIS